MSIEGATSAPQIGRLFLRSHGDCFIHGTQWWLKYWNFSITKDRLAIVRVSLPNGGVFLSTLSPNSVPWERVARGVNRRQYLEIDPKFALELGIGPDTEVIVESIREVEDCVSLVLAPVTPSDYDKLEDYSEKIDFELTERIRVVSCRRSFPIWIDNVIVPVRVVSSDPSAHWVVLVPNRTLVHIQRDDTSSPNTGTGISTRSTPGQASSGSEDTPSNKTGSTTSTLSLPASQQSAKRHWDFPNGGYKKPRKKSSSSTKSTSTTGSSVDTSPTEETSDPLENSLISGISGLWSNFSKYLSRDNSQIDEQPPQRLSLKETTFNASQDSVGFNPQQQPFPGVRLEEVGDFGDRFDDHVARPVALPPRALLDPNASPHRQVMQELTHKVRPYNGPLYSGGGGRPGTHTPDPSPPGRAESGSATTQAGPSKGKHQRVHTWHSGSDFSQYSRPSSSRTPPRSKLAPTPRINANLRAQPHGIAGLRSFTCISDSTTDGLWPQNRLFDIFIHPSTIPEVYRYWHQLNKESFLVQISATNPVPCDLKEPKPSTIQEDINDLKLDSRSVSSIQSSRTDSPANSALPCSLVVRLCFATRVRLVDASLSSTIKDSCNQGKVVEAESVTDDPADVLVAVGHVVMSDVVRQQLGIKACSVVRLLHVKDEWRIPYADKPSLTLQPLKPEDKHRSVHIKTRLEDWIRAVSHLSSVGAVLVNKQIVPVMRNEDGEWVYCRIWINRITRKLAPHIYFLLATPTLIDKNKLPLHVDLSSSSSGTNFSRPVMVHIQRDPSPSRDETITMPAMKSLNQPVVDLGIEQFRALESLYREGVEYMQTVFSESGRGGTLLVCGMSGSGGSGCGKTTLAKLLSKAVTGHPHYSSLAFIDCTALRGLTTQNFKKRLKAQFCEAIRNQPSVILLDDLDHTMPHVSDAQEQVGEEGNASIRKTQVLLDLLELVQRREAQVVVIATAQNKQQLNKDLMQSRGVHIFEKTLEITPPSLADRKVILASILSSKAVNTLNDQELRAVAVKTEGFQPGDLVTLVDRAISLCELRTLYPAGAVVNTPASPDKTPKWSRFQRSRVSTDGASSDYEYSSSPGLSKSPLIYGSSPTFSTPPSSPRKKHRGSDGNPKLAHLKKTSIVSTESTHTLIPEDSVMEGDRQLRHSTSLSQMRLSVEDFLKGLKGFVPVSLRGLPLHRGGTIDFSGVGGLKTVKKCLKETLQWPSKYPRLFGQCPIKQRCGVLLYGAPGTGKTMLAGAVAKEFGLNFVSIKGPELLSKYIGASEQAVRDVFTRALCAKPCILFFDEFDSLAPRRGHDNTGVTDRVVNQLLTQLDGVESLQGVYVLAASSRPDLIDPALLRPGRIDRSLLCDMPTEEERTEILKALSHKMPLARDVDLKVIASKATGMTGADLKGVLYSAQLQAAHEALAQKSDSEHSLSASSETEAINTPDTSGRGSSIVPRSDMRPLVFNFKDGGARRKSQVPSTVESTALALRRRGSGQSLRQRRATLTRDTASEGSLLGKKKGRSIVITQEHLLYGLTQVQPSVSKQKLKQFNQIYDKFSGKTKTTVENIKPTATMA